MTYVLYTLFVIACIVLVVSILLQPGKADAGALFTNSISTTAFGPRGTQTLLAKITLGAAAAFMLIAFIMSLPIVSGTRSVLDTQTAPAASPTPAPLGSPAANATASPQSSATPAASPSPAASASPQTSAANPKESKAKVNPSPAKKEK